MAKLSDDQIRFVLDLDVAGAQGEINTFEAETQKLEKQNASLQQSLRSTTSELQKQEKQLEKMAKAGKQSTDKYKELEASISKTRQRQAELTSTLKQNQQTIDKNREKTAQLTSTLKTSEMTMRQLRERASQLKRQLEVTSKAASPEAYRRLQKELEETTQAMGQLTEKQKSLSMVIKTAYGTFIGNIATKAVQALVGAIRQGVSTISDFEQANANLASVLGKTQMEVEALTKDARRLGEITSYTASEITGLQTELAKLGFSEKEILASTEAIQAFATATGATLPDAASVAGAALRAFGLEATEMSRVVSTLGVATSKSALDFGYLQNSIATIAPVAKTFGFTIEDTTALLGTLANAGFDASSAATASRNILLNLANTSGKLATALGEPIKSMDELIPALRKLQEQGVDLATALELTDKRSVAAFSTFLSGTDALEELRIQITGVDSALHQMQAERLNTVQGSVALLKSAWEGLMLQFYNSKGVFKDIVDLTTRIVGGLRSVVQWAQKNATFVKTLVTVMGTYYATGKAITLWRKSDLSAIIAQTAALVTQQGATKALKTANDALTRSLMKSPWGALAIAITAVVSALVLYIQRAKEASVVEQSRNETLRRQKELTEQNTSEIKQEQIQLNTLVNAIIKTNNNEKLRADMIDQLQQKYPDFLKNLDKEKVTNEELKGALELVNKQYNERIELLALQAEAQAYSEEIVSLQRQKIEEQYKYQEARSKNNEKNAKKAEEQIKLIDDRIKHAIKRVGELQEEIAATSSRMQFNESLEGIEAQMQEKEAFLKRLKRILDNIELSLQDASGERKRDLLNQKDYYKKQVETAQAAYNQLKAIHDQRKKQIEEEEAARKKAEEEEKKRQREMTKAQGGGAAPIAEDPNKALKEALAEAERLHKEMVLRDTQMFVDGEISRKEYEQRMLDDEIAYYEEIRCIQEEAGQSTLDIDQKIADFHVRLKKSTQEIAEETSEVVQEATEEANDALKEFGEAMGEVSSEMGDTLGSKLLSNVQKAANGIGKMRDTLADTQSSTLQKVAASIGAIGQTVNSTLQSISETTAKLFEMETSKLEEEKNKQLEIAGENTEERERIELEYAEKELELKKKQADADAALSSAQLWISTAQGIATAWATAMELGSIAGPIVAGVLTGALLTTAGIEQAQIIKQRDAIRSQTLDSAGGSSSSATAASTPTVNTTYALKPEYANNNTKATGTGFADGGYTGDGGVLEPAGVVHKGEYVVAQAEMRNPRIVPMVRAIEATRQERISHHGLYRTDGETHLQAPLHGGARSAGRRGYADGGYVGESDMLMGVIRELAAEVRSIRETPLRAEVNYYEFETAQQKVNTVRQRARK